MSDDAFRRSTPSPSVYDEAMRDEAFRRGAKAHDAWYRQYARTGVDPDVAHEMDARLSRKDTQQEVADRLRAPLPEVEDVMAAGIAAEEYRRGTTMREGIVVPEKAVTYNTNRSDLPPVRHPRDLLAIRDAVIAVFTKNAVEMGLSKKRIDAEMREFLISPDNYGMYFTKPDFADLHAELRSTLPEKASEAAHSLLEDIAAEHGDRGSMLIAFDDRHQPRVNLEFRLSPAMDAVFGENPNGTVRRNIALTWSLLTWRRAADGLEATCMMIPSRHESATGLNSEDVEATPEAVIIAWMMLSAQRKSLTVATEVTAGAGLPPKAKRDLSKAAQRTPITVVDLRRTVVNQIHDVREAEGRHLWVRFIVRGHWRKQPVGPGRMERRNVWVAPYVKGPEGAEFVKREKVFRY